MPAATLLARRLHPDSVYTAELRRRGIPWDRSIPERLALLQRDARSAEATARGDDDDDDDDGPGGDVDRPPAGAEVTRSAAPAA